MGPQRGGPVKWRRSPRARIAAAIAIIEKKKLAGAGLAPIKPVKFRRSPREIIAAAKVIIEKKKMAPCRKALLRQAPRQPQLIEHLLWQTEAWQDSCGAAGGLGQVDVWRIDPCGHYFTLG